MPLREISGGGNDMVRERIKFIVPVARVDEARAILGAGPLPVSRPVTHEKLQADDVAGPFCGGLEARGQSPTVTHLGASFHPDELTSEQYDALVAVAGIKVYQVGTSNDAALNYANLQTREVILDE